MYIRIHNKLINVQRDHFTSDEDFFNHIIYLKYNKYIYPTHSIQKILSNFNI